LCADAEETPATEMGDLDDPTAMFGKKKKKKSKDTEMQVSAQRQHHQLPSQAFTRDR
jgi:hypothetical protein